MQKVEIKLIDYKVAKAQKKKQWTGQQKGITFLFRVGRRMVRTKTFQKSQITGYKSRNLRLPKKAMTKVLKRVNWTPL